MRRSNVVFATAVALAIGHAIPAMADTEAERAAERLFNEAKDLAGAGKYAEACPKLEESQRLDPALGTEFNLADCYEHVGRTATAWRLFVDVERAAKAAGKAEREESARTRAGSLAPGLARLHVVASAVSAVPGLVVRRDGVELAREEWDAATPVDPGSHTVEASAPGKKPWLGKAVVDAHASVEITIPPLEDDASRKPPHPITPPIVRPDPSAGGLGAQRTIAIVAGAVGVVGIGVGATFGAISLSKHGDATSVCPMPNPCGDRHAAQTWSDATSAGNISTLAFVVGGAALAGAAVLWFTAPASPSQPRVGLAPAIGIASAGITLRGAW